MFLFQKLFGSPFPEDVWAWWLLMHWPQLQFTPCEALPSVWICFAWQYSQACGYPCYLCTFHTQFLPCSQLCINMLWYSTPWTVTPFSNDPLWLTLSVEGVYVRLLDHCQVSSVPQFCGFKEQEIPRIHTVWMVIYWNSNVKYWFWLSLTVSFNHQIKKQFYFCFTLHIMNLNIWKFHFFLNNYKKKLTFSPYSNFLYKVFVVNPVFSNQVSKQHMKQSTNE